MKTFRVFGKLETGKDYSYLITCLDEAHARSIMFYEAAKYNALKNGKRFDIVSIYAEEIN